MIYLAECTLYTFAASIEAQFRAAGLCVICVARPGYGATSPPADREDDLACMAADVEAVVDQLGADPVVIAGHGISASYSFALAAACPHLVSRVVIFAGTVPRPYLDERLTRAPFAAALLRARDAAPHLFRLIVRNSGAAWRRLGTRRFSSLNLAGSDADLALVRTPDCLEEFDHALGAQFAKGSARLEADLLLGTEDWSDHVARCPAPAILVHGIEDPVIHISTVRAFAAHHDNLTLVEVPDAGYLLHHAGTDAFLDTLRSDLPG